MNELIIIMSDWFYTKVFVFSAITSWLIVEALEMKVNQELLLEKLILSVGLVVIGLAIDLLRMWAERKYEKERKKES